MGELIPRADAKTEFEPGNVGAKAAAVPRILLVNDDSDELFLLRHAITQAMPKSEILEERTSADALDLLRRTSVDVIVSDNGMPLMSGVELVREIRKTDNHTPILLVTASAHLERAAVEAGATAFLAHTDYREVSEKISQLLCSRV